MSVTSLLAALLAFGFVVVGLVGFLGWRARMRDDQDWQARASLRTVVIVAVFPVLAGIEFLSCR